MSAMREPVTVTKICCDAPDCFMCTIVTHVHTPNGWKHVKAEKFGPDREGVMRDRDYCPEHAVNVMEWALLQSTNSKV